MAYAFDLPLDLFHRIQVDSASISVFQLHKESLRVLLLNGSSDACSLLPGLDRLF